MKFNYDSEVDVLYIQLKDEDITESEEVRPGVVLDIGKDGNLVGIEILDASVKFGHKPDLVVEL